MSNRKVILPIVAALVLLAIMWFAFRDDSAQEVDPKAVPATHPVASAVAVDASLPTVRARLTAVEIRGLAG